MNYGVIVPRLQQLYQWSSHELAAPGLLDFICDGAMTYAWSLEDRIRLATTKVFGCPHDSACAPS